MLTEAEARANLAESERELAAARTAQARAVEAYRAEHGLPALVSMDALKGALSRVAAAIVENTQPLRKRIAELEERVDALDLKPMGISIQADNVSVPGMEGVSRAVERLDATLSKPVRPIFDERGMLAGAERVDHLPGAARARKPHLKYSGGAWVSIDGFHNRRDAR